MNPEIKAKWVAALRSGEYEQGVGALKANGRFCCLGVLCDLYAKEGKAKWDERFKRSEMLGHAALAPEDVLEWAGFPGDCMGHVELVIAKEHHSLPQFNDGSALNETIQRRTFAEIADAIEAQL